MTRGRILWAALLAAAVAACDDSATSSVDELVVETDFEAGAADGWTVAYADYPPGDEAIYEFESGVRPLPAPLDTASRGMYVAGSNRSDDLFMFLKRRVEGLTPGAEYRVRYEIDLASDEGSGCIGIGGAPGEAVTVKAGATTTEPTVIPDAQGWLRLDADKGNQSEGGDEAVVLGDIANGSEECSEGPYRIKRLDGADRPVVVTADASGRAWLLVGTDSGYEGVTRLYYDRIRVVLRRV